MDVHNIADWPSAFPIDTDVCIVGSGPAGLTLARELTRNESARRVIVLESGGTEADSWTDALNEIQSTGAPRVMDQTLVRNRVLGGTSSTWSGRAATFDELDFASRGWVPDSGWPISRESLLPYFLRSAEHLGLGIADNMNPGKIGRVYGTLPDFDDRLLMPYIWSYSRDSADPSDFMRFGRRAVTETLRNVRLLTHATVTEVCTTEDGSRVTGVEVGTRDGVVHSVRAGIVVVCAGGIENARILLASNRVNPSGVGNDQDLVGRFLMDHPRGTVARFKKEDFTRTQRIFGGRRVDFGSGSTSFTVGVALSPQIQRDEQLLNCSAWVSRVVAPRDPFDAMSALRSRNGNPLRHLGSVVRGAKLVTTGVARYVAYRRSPARLVEQLTLECMVEQRPDRDSRVTLSDTRDALGVRQTSIDWRVSDQEKMTVQRMGELAVRELSRLGLPVPTILPEFGGEGSPLSFPDVAHPSGTTRMSADWSAGVVDTNLQVFGVSGLFVAGSSVFPTSGHANPTQMIVALSVRLADHLRGLLQLRPAHPAANVSDTYPDRS